LHELAGRGRHRDDWVGAARCYVRHLHIVSTAALHEFLLLNVAFDAVLFDCIIKQWLWSVAAVCHLDVALALLAVPDRKDRVVLFASLLALGTLATVFTVRGFGALLLARYRFLLARLYKHRGHLRHCVRVRMCSHLIWQDWLGREFLTMGDETGDAPARDAC